MTSLVNKKNNLKLQGLQYSLVIMQKLHPKLSFKPSIPEHVLNYNEFFMVSGFLPLQHIPFVSDDDF